MSEKSNEDTRARPVRRDYRETLTDALPELSAPFTISVVKFKALTKPNAQKKSAVAIYVDARMVVERLNHVVGAGAWEDAYTVVAPQPQAGLPVECALTVLGVTKRDVGQIAPSGSIDDKAWKSAYSDALKRAAVKFGIGAYLYKLSNVWEEVVVGQDGKAKGFTLDAQRRLRANYQAWLNANAERFGEPLDHGDPLPELVDPEGHVVAAAEPNPAPAGLSTNESEFASEHEVAKLLDLAGEISAQARGWVDGIIKKHRASTGGRVTRSFLQQGTTLVNEKRAAAAAAGGSFTPPANVQAELAAREGDTTAHDVERAFQNAA